MILKKVNYLKKKDNSYPFQIPYLKQDFDINFNNKLIFFVGNNGSGKTTLLEAIAHNANLINVSSDDVFQKTFNEGVRKLSEHIQLSFAYKTKKGFYFSSEQFITYITKMRKLRSELMLELNELEEEFKDKSDYVRMLALGPVKSSIHQIDTTYQGELGSKSHGEGFLSFFKNKIHQKGLYLLDEPETPLSAVNVYTLMHLISNGISDGSQFIIATHSPILLSYPGSVIYEFTDNGIHQVHYNDIENVYFTKRFLSNTDAFVNDLK